MDGVLDRSAFSGSVLDAHRAGARFAGTARFSGCFACTTWPRSALEKLLPPSLALAPNVSGTADVHPLLFLFGQQREGSILFGGMTVPMGQQFTEFGVAIPYVTRRDEPHLHTYVPRMYSSGFAQVRDGNVHYGFNKQQAALDHHGPIVTLSTSEGPLLWHAAVEAAGPWRRNGEAASASATALQAAFALPIIGRKESGRYVRSYFDLGWRDALIRPVRCAMSIDAPLIDGLDPQSCASATDGAVEVRGMLWRLSWPEQCEWT